MEAKKYLRGTNFSDRELLDIFPEARGIIPLKIKEWEEQLKDRLLDIKVFLMLANALKLDLFSEWFWEEVVRVLLLPGVSECHRQISRLSRMLAISSPGKNRRENFSEKIEKARSYPILQLVEGCLKLKKSGEKFISKCPFHNEKSPSFFVYPESNDFHCFGCQAHGDVIKLAMHIFGVEFREAVELLQNL